MKKNNGKAYARAGVRKTKKPYTEKGYFVGARIWLGGDMAQFPTAFTLYVHLLGWANHADGNLQKGQVALGERDMGQRLGLSILTVRKWLRWLSERGWIELRPTRHGRIRGSVVTVLRYTESQAFATYDKTTSEDQKMILTPYGSEDQKMILTRLSEDQKMILNPPSEDQKMIPHNPVLLSYSGDAQRQCPMKSQGGDGGKGNGGLGLPAESISAKALAELHAKLDSLGARPGKRPVGSGGRARTVPLLEGEGPKPLEGATPA